MRSALYVSPHEADEVALGQAFVTACEEADVRTVFVGVHVSEPNPLRQALFRMLFATLLSHYRGKLKVARTIERSQTRPVILMPSNFMQNDEVFREELVDGEFVQPLAGRLGGVVRGPEPAQGRHQRRGSGDHARTARA